MKKKLLLQGLFVIISLFFFSKNISAQQPIRYLQPKTNNFTSFTTTYKPPSKKWLEVNKGYAGHPDAGYLSKDIPRPGAIEVLAKRTRNSRYFIDGNKSAAFYIVNALGDINYLKNGEWLRIDKRLTSKGKNIFEASRQPDPVGFDREKKASYIKTSSGIFYFNDWELMGMKNKTETLLAKADWTNFSAGDDGIRIINIFPGIDAEMIVDKGSVKTNFIVKQNQFPGYDQLIFSDQYFSPATTQLMFPEGSVNEERQSTVNINIGNKTIAQIGKAVMYSKNQSVKNYQVLNYSIAKNNLSLIVDANDLNRQLINGATVVDPLVAVIDSLTTSSITGSMSNCTTNTQTCNYNLQMQTPAKATCTSIAFQFGYYAYAPSAQEDGDFSIAVGNCNSGNFTVDRNGGSITQPGIVSTEGEWIDISSLLNCFPEPSCTGQPVTFTLLFYNTYCGNAVGCSNEYVAAEEALQILIEGHTLEIDSVNNTTNITAVPATICQGASSTLTGVGAYGVTPYTYSWTNGAGNNNIETVTPAGTTVYTVTITDKCQTTASGNVTVNVIPVPVISSVSSNSPVCLGSTINLSAPPIAGVTYNWTGPNNFTSSVQDPAISNATTAESGEYDLTVASSNGCSSQTAKTNVVVTTPVAPSLIINASMQTICPGASVVFNAVPANGGPAPSYQWLLNGTATGTNSSTYTGNSLTDGDTVSCVLTSNAACISSATAVSNRIPITVSTNIAPTITIAASANNICMGAPVTFTATAVNSVSSSYQWQLNGNNVGTNDSVYSTGNLVNGDKVSCVVTSNSPCFGVATAGSNTITMTVIANTTPSLSITASNNNFCSGTPVTFTATAIHAGATPSYQWQINGTPTGLNSSMFTSDQIANADQINCVLTVSDSGCFSSPTATSNSIAMTVYPVPRVAITAGDTIIMKGSNTTLTATVSGSYTGLLWQPAAGLNDTTILDPVAAPLATTSYRLTVISTDGCVASKNITIQVFTRIYIPNAFTPNGDGINDLFRIPPGIVFNLTDLSIYDRWGNKVFETNNINNGWDGTFGGSEAPEGTYVYFISGSNPNGNVFFKGTVTLIR